MRLTKIMIKVVKIGGNVVDNPELLREFVRDFAAMPAQKFWEEVEKEVRESG